MGAFHPLTKAIIVLLLKPGKDPLGPGSYRLISLLQTDVKILAKVLAIRLNKVISTVIPSDQAGFMPQNSTAINLCRLFINIQSRSDNMGDRALHRAWKHCSLLSQISCTSLIIWCRKYGIKSGQCNKLRDTPGSAQFGWISGTWSWRSYNIAQNENNMGSLIWQYEIFGDGKLRPFHALQLEFALSSSMQFYYQLQHSVKAQMVIDEWTQIPTPIFMYEVTSYKGFISCSYSMSSWQQRSGDIQVGKRCQSIWRRPMGGCSCSGSPVFFECGPKVIPIVCAFRRCTCC